MSSFIASAYHWQYLQTPCPGKSTKFSRKFIVCQILKTWEMLIDEHNGYIFSEELLRSHVVYKPVHQLEWKSPLSRHSQLQSFSSAACFTDTLKTLIAERTFKIIPDTGSSITAGLVLADCSVTVLNILASDCFPYHIQLFGAHLQFMYAADEARDIPHVVVHLWEGWNATKERGAEHHLNVGRKKGDIC